MLGLQSFCENSGVATQAAGSGNRDLFCHSEQSEESLFFFVFLQLIPAVKSKRDSSLRSE
jgi:hypothetical protein